MHYEDSREFALAEDAADPLAGFRERFRFPTWRSGHSPVYLCGNSLGLQSDLARRYVEEELDNWAEYAVDGHFHSQRPWKSYHRLATAGFAALTGAKATDVIAMNTLTVNLHLLMASFYRPTPSRYRIIIEDKAFPSDRYACASQLEYHGFDAKTGLIDWPSRDGELHIDDLAALLDEHGDSVAMLLLPGVQYFSGQVLDMAAICELGRRHGCVVGLDLAHAVGNVALELDRWSPDFASWCTYKYLNAGPGAIAGAFIPARHADTDGGRALLGWWGNDEKTRFRMRREFDPAPGAEAWQMSNPPILSLAPVVASLELFREAGFARLIAKSQQLTGYLEWLIAKRFDGVIQSITPRHAQGCQSSLVVSDERVDARRLFDRLCELNVTGDWREPNVIRVAPAPLYNSFSDVFDFAERLRTALDEQARTA